MANVHTISNYQEAAPNSVVIQGLSPHYTDSAPAENPIISQIKIFFSKIPILTIILCTICFVVFFSSVLTTFFNGPNWGLSLTLNSEKILQGQ
ncbi:hypothetical protein AYI68_g5674, partial [Smittium mucronatum]